MFEAYVKLSVAALLPVFVLIIFYLLDKKTSFGKLKWIVKQIIYGVIFGGLAIIGTEYGIPLNGAQVNCRDAAVVTAGLFFGGPAGIIAGFIGGLERWLSVYWGVGSFTRVACSVSTFLAGVYSAVIRKYMLEKKKPGWFFAFVLAVVIEVFHLSMVFVTNLATPTEAMRVVRVCTIPMITANGLSVLLSAVAITLLSKEKLIKRTKTLNISKIIQRWLLVTVVLAFISSSYLVYSLQSQMASNQSSQLLKTSISDVVQDINDASDRNMLTDTRKIEVAIGNDITMDLATLAENENVPEIHIIDQTGRLINSSIPSLIGFDMYTEGQSKEFCEKLLEENLEEFVQPYGPTSSDSERYIKYAGVKTDYGFMQIGYDRAKIQSDLRDQLTYITRNRHVGENGFMIVLGKKDDDSFEVISAPIHINLEENVANWETVKEGVVSPVTIDGELFYVCFQRTESYYIVSLMSKAEVLNTRNIAIYVNTFLEVLIFAVLFILLYILIKRVVVDKLKKINTSLAKIASGNLNVVVNVRGNEEFASLSDDINSTVDTLKRYIDEASKRIDAELEMAKSIQLSALPAITPVVNSNKNFNVFAMMEAAKEVGGDFYDFYYSNEDIVNLLIADVSGKGIPAAMFMMRGKSELKNLTESYLSLGEVFTKCNDALCESNDSGMFITAWQGSVNLATGEVTFVNAGHNPPLIKKKNGKFEYFKTPAGFVLAGMEDFPYKEQKFTLEKGDIIFLYTDGVTEATNIDKKLYGEDRLTSILNSREFSDMKELCRAVKADIDEFVGEADQFDDITMLAFKYIGPTPTKSISFEDAKLEHIEPITEFVEGELEKMHCPMATTIQINVAIDEIVSNIVKYGYEKYPGPITVKIKEKNDPHSVSITFIDKGIPYNPLKNADPDITLSAEERQTGGLGIYLVKKTMDEVKYKYEQDQNILTIIKKF